MRPVAAGLFFSWFYLGLWCMPAKGDGGTVRVSREQSGCRITVFSSPSPLRAGPVDISVLVQDARKGEPLLQARVTIRMTKIGEPVLEYEATHEVASNKILYARQFEIPVPGRWHLEVRIEGLHGAGAVTCELEAAEPLPRWLEMWPWICAPALAIALFGIHQLMARRAMSKTSA
jgi:hypothetical protein